MKKYLDINKEFDFYIFLLLFTVVATGLRYLHINVLDFKMGGEFSPIITTLIFILLIRKDSFRLICFNRFDLKVLVTPILILLLIIGVDFFIQLKYDLIKTPVIDTAFYIRLIIFLAIFSIAVGGFEEIAWRGYLISKIIQNGFSWNSLIIITGVIWSIWHLPTHFHKFETHLYIQYPLFITTCFELGIIMAYLRLKTKSVIPAIILHSVITVSYESFFKHSAGPGYNFYFTLPCLFLLILFFPLSFYYF